VQCCSDEHLRREILFGPIELLQILVELGLMVGTDPNTDEYMQVKICDFGLSAMRTISASDKVLGLQVSVDASLRVQMCHAVDDLVDPVSEPWHHIQNRT